MDCFERRLLLAYGNFESIMYILDLDEWLKYRLNLWIIFIAHFTSQPFCHLSIRIARNPNMKIDYLLNEWLC